MRAPPLPPGQHAIEHLPRFGQPAFVSRWPAIPPHPVLRLGGDIEEAVTLGLDALAALPRVEQRSDLHCVTTWSRCGLAWGGHRLRDVYEQLIVPRARPAPGVRHLSCLGLDGFRTSLPLEDALAADVLLADQLDGNPLSLEHGAPLRLLAPAHYGYKSVKHLCELGLWREPPRPVLGWLEHPRALVWREERGRGMPGWLLRWPYRATIPLVAHYVRRAAARGSER
jgi:DMSO/TMAO reductase YedYZ molybdopterin-dependent catalytic subunit